MGINFNELKNKARGLVGKHGDKIEQGLDKASDLAKKRMGNDPKIDKAVNKAKDFVRDEKQRGKPDDQPGSGDQGPKA
jgi:hypothetical protein